MKRDESGMLLLEFTIYFPILLLTWFFFIIASLAITQRVVLDRAVSLAATEGAAWMSNDIHSFRANDFILGGPVQIRTNPYTNTFASLTNPFTPATPDQFRTAMENRVRTYAGWSLASTRAVGLMTLYVNVHYDSNLVGGDLIVTARQRVNIPIDFSLLGFNRRYMEFNASARARVFNHGQLINNVNFIFDALRHIGVGDISGIQARVSGFPQAANTWATEAMKSGEAE